MSQWGFVFVFELNHLLISRLRCEHGGDQPQFTVRVHEVSPGWNSMNGPPCPFQYLLTLESSAAVVYSQQDCGVGVAFRDVRSVFLAVLHKWLRRGLDEANAPQPSAEEEV
jgi:hypothetical protein